MAGFRLQGILQSAHALRRRMAGARGCFAARAGPRNRPAIFRCGTPRADAGALGGWARLVVALAAGVAVTGAGAQVLSSRIWPAPDYTRLTLESKSEIKFNLFSVKDPERLVLDLEVAD